MSKWSQCKESNDAATNKTTNPATGIMSLSATAHVSFEIVSARRFAKEFKRGRNGISMAFQELQEDLEEMRRSENEHRAEMLKRHEEFFADMQRRHEEFLAGMEEFHARMQRRQEEFLAGIRKDFDRLDRHLILVSLTLHIICRF